MEYLVPRILSENHGFTQSSGSVKYYRGNFNFSRIHGFAVWTSFDRRSTDKTDVYNGLGAEQNVDRSRAESDTE